MLKIIKHADWRINKHEKIQWKKSFRQGVHQVVTCAMNQSLRRLLS